jgi:ATP-binding cassette subfamily F protein 3
LGAFLFTGEDVNKKVGVLSGGERTRLALCQLLLSPSNFLILDEPTNHLDMQSKEVLKEALKNYEGTFLVVSHDREFLEGLTNRIWDIENHTLKIHHFGVKEFLIRKMNMPQMNGVETSKPQTVEQPVAVKTETSDDSKELKKQRNQLSNQLKTIENTIEQLEATLKEMDEIITSLDYSDSEKSSNIISEYQSKKAALDESMLEWEKTSDALIKLG